MMPRGPLQCSSHGADTIVVGVNKRIIQHEGQPVTRVRQQACQSHAREYGYLLLRAVAQHVQPLGRSIAGEFGRRIPHPMLDPSPG